MVSIFIITLHTISNGVHFHDLILLKLFKSLRILLTFTMSNERTRVPQSQEPQEIAPQYKVWLAAMNRFPKYVNPKLLSTATLLFVDQTFIGALK